MVSTAISIPRRAALDGVRGLAVVAVLLFHAGELGGGYLGVDLFFVLSGYLITSILVAEVGGTGGVSLVSFWARRARRLLPALFLVLLFVAAYAAVIASPSELQRIRYDGLATLAYVANWRFVFGRFDYFALFASPSPLNHTWSLAIEEQFYLIWPVAFSALLLWGRRGRVATRESLGRGLCFVALALAVASAGLAAWLWVTTHNATRIYYGTDTRAGSILLGIALCGVITWKGPARERSVRVLVEVCAIVGAGVLAVAWYSLSGSLLYQGGLVLCGLAGVAVIAAAAQSNPGPLARGLSFAPFVWLGAISYGLYLWHWPIYLWLDSGRVGVSGWPLFVVRMAVTLPIAVLSFFLVERPIRRGAFGRATVWLTPLAAAGLVVVTFVSTTGYVPELAIAGGASADPAFAARTALTTPGARRLMVVGNSVAYFLAGEGFANLAVTPRLVTLNMGEPACVFPGGEQFRLENFGPGRPAIPCDGRWASAVQQFRPEIVLMAYDDGTGELLHHGRWLGNCDPAFAPWYRRDLGRAMQQLRSLGAHVVMTTAAYSTYYGLTDAARRQADCKNGLLRSFVRSHPSVGFVDLARFVCPSRHVCHDAVRGATLRADGIHYKGSGARLVAGWLLPRLGFSGPPLR